MWRGSKLPPTTNPITDQNGNTDNQDHRPSIRPMDQDHQEISYKNSQCSLQANTTPRPSTKLWQHMEISCTRTNQITSRKNSETHPKRMTRNRKRNGKVPLTLARDRWKFNRILPTALQISSRPQMRKQTTTISRTSRSRTTNAMTRYSRAPRRAWQSRS